MVLAGVAYLLTNKKTKEPQTKLGEKRFETIPINEVVAINIQSKDDTVVLKKGDKVWEVETRFNYPANFSKIADTLKKIKDIKVGRTFPADEETIARLGLHDPTQKDKPYDQKGTRIILKNKDNQPIADLIFGKEREASAGGGGQYFKLTAESTVYMADSSFRYTDKKSADWLDKDLFKVNAEDIQQVICMNPKDQSVVYKLKRDQKGESPEFIDLPNNRKPNRSKINSLFGAISAFQIDDIADPADKSIDFGGMKYIEFHLFDGTVYKLYPGKALPTDSEKYYLKTEVAYIKPEIKPDPKVEETPPTDQKIVPLASEPKPEGSDAKSETKPQGTEPPKETIDYEKLSKQANELNQKLSNWVYIIPKWRYQNLTVDPEELLEKPEEKKEEPAPPVEKKSETEKKPGTEKKSGKK